MDGLALLTMLAGLHPMVPVVLAVLGILVVVGQAVVIMTPTKKDDEVEAKIEGIPILGSIVKALAAFAPIQKK